MIKVLAIGNSFSQDATRYLRAIAKAAGEDMKVVNLYIGGCPLSTHYKHMNNDEKAYSLEFGGETTDFFVSIREALQSDIWDFVSLQQVSSLSVNYDTYQPYLNALSAYVSLHAPKAKQVIHQTWAYEDASQRLTELGYKTSEKMFADLKVAYNHAAKDISAAFIIPSGEAMMLAIKDGHAMHRDTFHAHLGHGRFLLGAVWYEMLTGNSVVGNTFCDLDVPARKDTVLKMQEIAHKAAELYR